MPPGHIVGHLDNILGQEGVSFEQPALRLLERVREVLAGEIQKRGARVDVEDRSGGARAQHGVTQQVLLELEPTDRSVMVRNDDQRQGLLRQRWGRSRDSALPGSPGTQASRIPACLATIRQGRLQRCSARRTYTEEEEEALQTTARVVAHPGQP